MMDETSRTHGKIRSTNEEPGERRKDGRTELKMCLKDMRFEVVKGINVFSLAVVPRSVLGRLVVEVSESHTDTHYE
jgi:hypothetical protein